MGRRGVPTAGDLAGRRSATVPGSQRPAGVRWDTVREPGVTRRYAEVRDIDYAATLRFFERRAERASSLHPLSVTMYQDAHPELAEARDRAEQARILPLLDLHPATRALDVGCGTGRWGRILAGRIGTYLGVDFSAGLVEIARRELAPLYGDGVAAVQALPVQALGDGGLAVDPPFDLVLVSGVLIYLNDEDCAATLRAIDGLTSDGAQLYMREPVGTGQRLTLDGHWSDELADAYSAIYRTAADYHGLMASCLPGWSVTDGGSLHPAQLANRADTSQAFWILRRGSGG